jgi:hypothetical protein
MSHAGDIFVDEPGVNHGGNPKTYTLNEWSTYLTDFECSRDMTWLVSNRDDWFLAVQESHCPNTL